MDTKGRRRPKPSLANTSSGITKRNNDHVT